MASTIEAIYEGGIFRPTRQVVLAEGTHVTVLVPSPSQRDPKAVAARLATIAGKARGTSESTSRDHDQILYAFDQHFRQFGTITVDP